MKIGFKYAAAVLAIPLLLSAQSNGNQASGQSTPGTAQSVARHSGPPLPPEDPALYRLFFAFCDKLLADVQAKKLQDAKAGAKMQTAVAHLLKISESDLPQVTSVAHGVVVGLALVQSNRQAYQTQVQSQQQTPDPSKVAGFDQQKKQVTDNAVSQLTASLPVGSWQGLHSFIQVQFRARTGTSK